MRAATLAALSGTALALATGLGGALEAQGTAPAEARCLAIMKIVSGVVTDYTGQISTDLIADLQKKIGENGKCDGPDQYRIWPNTKDREALSRIRQLIAVWDACRKDPTHEGCRKTDGR